MSEIKNEIVSEMYASHFKNAHECIVQLDVVKGMW